MIDIDKHVVKNQSHGDNFSLYNADSVEIMANMPDNSIDYSLFSPPFASLFVYNDSKSDVGNNQSYDEFWEHYRYIVKELYRIVKPGRLISLHLMNLPKTKTHDGVIGIRDFRGDNIREFEKEGFIFHSEVTIWKDPLIQAVRTKTLGLMHKQLCKDSSKCQMGLPDYIVTMRKEGENESPIDHENGLHYFPGDEKSKKFIDTFLDNQPQLTKNEKFTVEHSHNIWRKIASPVWMDVRQTRTLNAKLARENDDERHLCPTSLDCLERCLMLWSNPDDIVFSPFNGVGSEGYAALNLGRKYIGCELKTSYYELSKKFLNEAENLYDSSINDLF